MNSTVPTPVLPLRIELTSAGMRKVLGSLAAVGLIFGVSGLGIGIGELFGEEKVPWPFFFMMPVPFTIVGGGIFLTAVLFFFRRITLQADGSGITRISMMFVFRRERHFPRPPLADVVYSFASGSSDALSLGKIHLAFDDGRRILLLQRYGMTETRRLADALRAAVFSGAEPVAQERPPGGALSILEDAGSLRLHLGPEPASRVGANSLALSIVLLPLSTLFLACFVAVVWQTDRTASGRTLAITVCVVLWMVFVAVCSTLFIRTRRRAREQADITLDATTLRVKVSGNGASRDLAWERSAIRSISVAPSGLQINDQPVFELYVLASGTPVRLFTGRDVRDLRWMADTISQRLALPNPASARHEVLQHLDSPRAVATLSTIDHKLKFGNWVRVPSTEGIVLQLPPSFLRGLVPYLFATAWLAMVTFMVVLSLMPSSHTPHSALLFLALFALPGLGVGYVGRRMTKATVRVEVSAATVMLRSTTLRTREVTIPCDKIESVGTGMAGGGDGNYGLYVDLKDGRQWIPLGFSHADLDSLADLLKIALALRPQ